MTLLHRLRQSVPDDRELEAVLSCAAGGPTRLLPQGKAEYITSDREGTVYATVKFKRGRVSQLTPGSALNDHAAQDALVERAAYETAHVHGNVLVSRVLFAERRLAGSFTWKDRFRIDPCPDTAPVAAGLNWLGQERLASVGEAPDGPPFPFILQVQVARSPNPFIESSRRLRDLDSFQHLLTLLVSGHIRAIDPAGERIWVTIFRNNNFENHLLHRGFTTGDQSLDADFRRPAHRPAPVFQGDDYYNHLWPQDPELVLPPSIDTDLELFHSLDRENSEAFKRAAYWYALGLRNRKESAISTLAFSTAIECLLPKLKRARCGACASEIGPGPTHLFKAHLSRFGTLPETLHKQRAALYDVRSSLVHGSFAASIDTDAFSIAGHTDNHDMLLELVTRRSLLNWLRDPLRGSWYDSPIQAEIGAS